MKFIVGLGNPGKEYVTTRHNIGFMFLDFLITHPAIEITNFSKEKKFQAEVATSSKDGEKLVLIKPQTFMNSSGDAVSKIISYYGGESSDLIVVCDDIDLPVGRVRVREEGSGGGQKGLQSIVNALNTEEFTRIRIGISDGEKVPKEQTSNYVLGNFSKRELPIIDRAISDSCEYMLEFIGKKDGIPSHSFEV